MANSRRNRRYDDDYDDNYYDDDDSRLDDLMDENERLKSKNQALQTKNKKLYKDCQSFAKRLNEIQQSGILTSAKDWETKQQDYEDKISSLNKQLRNLKFKNRQLQNQIDDATDSIPDIGGNANLDDYLSPSDTDQSSRSKKDDFTRSSKKAPRTKSSKSQESFDDDDLELADEEDIPVRRRSSRNNNDANYSNHPVEQMRTRARHREEEWEDVDDEITSNPPKPKNTPARTFWRVIVGILLVLVILVDIGVTALYVVNKRQGQIEIAGYGITTVENSLSSDGETVALPSDLLITNNKSRYEEVVGGNYIVTKDHQVAEATGWTNVGKTLEASENGATVQINKSQYFGRLSRRVENLGTLFKFTDKNPALAFGILALLTVFLIFIFMLLSPKRRKIKNE